MVVYHHLLNIDYHRHYPPCKFGWQKEKRNLRGVLHILKRQYAKGEITKEELEKVKEELTKK